MIKNLHTEDNRKEITYYERKKRC